MASRTPLRPALSAANRTLRHGARAADSSPTLFAAASARTPTTSPTTTPQQAHGFSTQQVKQPEPSPDPEQLPRWRQPYKAMTAPVRIRPQNPNNVWTVNQDPEKVDAAYKSILGRDGHKVLPEDAKWLAITHKSYDHGRQGLNDRLAFLGKRIIDLQASLALLNMPRIHERSFPDPHGREPFKHPALETLSQVSGRAKRNLVGNERLAKLAETYGFDAVVRWKPKQANDLKASGYEVVMATTMYAIVGALALQKGGLVADQVVKDKILTPLGVKSQAQRS